MYVKWPLLDLRLLDEALSPKWNRVNRYDLGDEDETIELPSLEHVPHGSVLVVQKAHVDASSGRLSFVPGAEDSFDDGRVRVTVTAPGDQVGLQAISQRRWRVLSEDASAEGSTWGTLAGKPEVVGSVGRAARDFGIGPERTAAQNATGFADAVEWATESEQSRTLIVPPIPAGEYINLEAPVELRGGFRMSGSGDSSRFFMRTEPEPGFIATGRVNISGLSFQGPPTRTVTTGQYAFGLRNQYGHLNYVGVLLLSGSDGSVVRDIYGQNVGITVAAWGYDPAINDYAGHNIQGLDIQGVYSKNVWAGVFWREVDNISVQDVYTENYMRQGTDPAESPPHGIYCTSTGAIAEKRYMRGGYVNNIQVFGGTNGSAVSFKYLVGAHISNVTAVGCDGMMDIEALKDSVVENVVGLQDSCRLAAGAAHPGAMNIRASERTTIDRVRISQTDVATARMLYLAPDNVDVEVRDFRGIANYPTGITGREEAILVRGGTLIRPNLKQSGTATLAYGIRRDVTGGNVVVTDPTVSGKIRRPLADSGGAAAVSRWQYDERNVSSDQSSGYPKMWAATGNTFVANGLGPAPEAGLLAWSDPKYDVSVDSGVLAYLASGHAVTSSVSSVSLNEAGSSPFTRWTRAGTATVSGDTTACVDVGRSSVDISLRIRIGSAPATAHGIVICYLDASNYMTVETRTTGVYLRSVVAGTATDVASYLFTRRNSRIYSLRALHHEARVTVWVDGTERISDGYVGGPAFAAYGASTKHGYYWRDASTGDHSAHLRVRAVG